MSVCIKTQNRSMNILTIWQKTFLYEHIKVAEDLDQNPTQLPLCHRKNLEQTPG